MRKVKACYWHDSSSRCVFRFHNFRRKFSHPDPTLVLPPFLMCVSFFSTHPSFSHFSDNTNADPLWNYFVFSAGYVILFLDYFIYRRTALIQWCTTSLSVLSTKKCSEEAGTSVLLLNWEYHCVNIETFVHMTSHSIGKNAICVESHISKLST